MDQLQASGTVPAIPCNIASTLFHPHDTLRTPPTSQCKTACIPGRAGMNTTKAKSNCWTCKGKWAHVPVSMTFYRRPHGSTSQEKAGVEATIFLDEYACVDKDALLSTYGAIVSLLNRESRS